ncbi:MAG: hypothetical protein Q9208_000157, partial [Pyrenodesmia sp. 3 TL-2023]
MAPSRILHAQQGLLLLLPLLLWLLALPTIATPVLPALPTLATTSATPALPATGWCGVHVTHYQIPKGDNKYYAEAKIYDGKGIEIGSLHKMDATGPVYVWSTLPYALVIKAAKPGSSDNPDKAPLEFAYAEATWKSGSGNCNFGGYENGNREGDCG